jgi:hypothetical protein
MNPSRKWPGLLTGLLVVAVFFEGSGFSLQFLGIRVRSVQLLEIVFLGFLGMLWLLGKWRWQKSPLDYWLLAYLGINFIAIFNSQWQARSVKIFLLLVSLALLYWLVYQLLRTAKDFFLAFAVFLAMGILQVLFGLYQVLAGALNHYRGWRLPIGHMGIVHQEYINSVWGRPYGTQVEPDFYGAICMVFALIFLILYFSKNDMSKKWLLAGAFVSLLGLYFSFVRAAWFVFVWILLLLPFCRKKFSFFRFTCKPALLIIGVAVGAHMIAVHTVPPIRQISQFRFATKVTADMEKNSLRGKAGPFTTSDVSLRNNKKEKENVSLLNNKNVRLLAMRISLWTWSEHPLIGYGPGSFAYVFWRHVYDEATARQRIAEGYLPWTNPCMLFSVLGDTGLLGLFIFLVIAGQVVFLNLKKNAATGPLLAPGAFAIFIGLASLFLSYMITTGLWLPLTWVILGLNIAALKRFPEVNEGTHAELDGVLPCA